MKIKGAVIVMMMLAVFAAGCGVDGGFMPEPQIGGNGPETGEWDDWDGTDDGGGNGGTIRQLTPEVSVNLPESDTAVYVRNGGTLEMNGSDMAQAPVLEAVDVEGLPVACGNFEVGRVVETCEAMACEEEGACTVEDERYITCGDIYDWMDALYEARSGCAFIEKKLNEVCFLNFGNDCWVLKTLKEQCDANLEDLIDLSKNSGCTVQTENSDDADSDDTAGITSSSTNLSRSGSEVRANNAVARGF